MTILNILCMVVTAIIAIASFIISIINWRKLPAAEKRKQIVSWLVGITLMLEKEYGSGTGKLKLAVAYDKFCERFPWVAKNITFETFSEYVDDALVTTRKLLAENANIASVVNSETDN